MKVEDGWTCKTPDGKPTACETTCGDAIKVGEEKCDDGNTDPLDGCSATCTIERGYYCSGLPKSTCATRCGDGIVAGDEECDD